jgi:hypothetical protein
MRVFLIIILAFHSCLSLYATYTKGFMGAFPPFEDIWTYQIFSDLLVSIVLLWLFLYYEAKKNNRPLWKVYLCAIGIFFSGSIAPLIYLITEKDVFRL